MQIDKHQYKSHCPINFSQEIFGDRWCLLIIRDLMIKGKKYYGELLESNEKISTNILANRLKKLQENGLISKTIDETNHSKNVYALTQKGVDLMPILFELILWGGKHDKDTAAPKELILRIETDRENLAQELIAKL